MERHGTFSEKRAHGSVGLTLVTISPCLPGKRASCKLSLWTVYCPAAAGQLSSGHRTAKQEFFFLHGRRANVYENKGPLWKEWAGSGNVYENKGSYEFKAGISMKTRRLMLCGCMQFRQNKTTSRLGGQANLCLISHAMPQPLGRKT